MADRFWIPAGTGNWNSTTNWSTTSGGSSGASVPSYPDNAYFDSNSGTNTITFNTSPLVGNFDMTGSGGRSVIVNNTAGIKGNFVVPTGINFVGAGALGIDPDTGTKSFDVASTLGCPLSFSGQAPSNGTGTMNFARNLTTTSNIANGTSGTTFNTSGVTITVGGTFVWGGSSSLNLGASTVNLTGGSGTTWSSGGTINLGTSTINVNSGTTFAGGGKTFYIVTINSTLTITGCNTYHILQVTAGRTISFPGSCTQTTDLLDAIGTSGSPIVFNTTGGGANISTINAGQANTSFVNVSNNTAGGSGAPFYDNGGNNGGNTTNWNFIAAPSTDVTKHRGGILFKLFG